MDMPTLACPQEGAATVHADCPDWANRRNMQHCMAISLGLHMAPPGPSRKGSHPAHTVQLLHSAHLCCRPNSFFSFSHHLSGSCLARQLRRTPGTTSCRPTCGSAAQWAALMVFMMLHLCAHPRANVCLCARVCARERPTCKLCHVCGTGHKALAVVICRDAAGPLEG